MLYLLRSFTRTRPLLKVGYASDVDKRITQYLSHSPGIEPIAVRNGDRIEEKLFHLYLHFLNYGACKDEWYEDRPEVITLFHSSLDHIKRFVWKNRDRIFPSSGWWRDDYPASYWRDLFEYLKPSDFEASMLSKSRVDVQYAKYVLGMNSATVSGDEELDKIILEFNNIRFFEDRMKFIADLYRDIIDQLLEYLPENFKHYLSVLGPDKIRALKYSEKAITQEISNITRGSDVERIIESKLPIGSRHTLKELKKLMSDVYDQLNITTTPKATDILKYFEVKEVKMLEDDKRVRGFEIIKKKEG